MRGLFGNTSLKIQGHQVVIHIETTTDIVSILLRTTTYVLINIQGHQVVIHIETTTDIVSILLRTTTYVLINIQGHQVVIHIKTTTDIVSILLRTTTYVLINITVHKKCYIPPKNDWPLNERCALVIDMCTGQREWPNISASTIDSKDLKKPPFDSTLFCDSATK